MQFIKAEREEDKTTAAATAAAVPTGADKKGHELRNAVDQLRG